MKSIKIATLLAIMTIATALNISAGTCYDNNGNPYECFRPVRNTGKFLGNVATLGGVSRAEKREAARRREQQNNMDNNNMSNNNNYNQE